MKTRYLSNKQLNKLIVYSCLITLNLLNIISCAPSNSPPNLSSNLVKSAIYNIQLGQGYLKQHDIIRARSKFAKALQQAPLLPEAHINMGYFLEQIGEYQTAELQYLRAIKLSKAVNRGILGKSLNSYGVFLCHRQRYSLALKQFNQAIQDKLYLQIDNAYQNAGICEFQLGNLSQAEKFLVKALQYEPMLSDALLYLASIKYQQKHYQIATAYLKNYLSFNKPNKFYAQLAEKIAAK